MLNKDKSYLTLFVLFLLLSLALKSFGLNAAIYDDEANYAYAAVNNEGLGYVKTHYSGLMAQWTFEPFIKLFGISPVAYRLTPLVFSTLTLILLFFTVRRLYGPKPALISVLFLLVSFYHNLASLQIDIEGGIMSLFYLLSIVCYIVMIEKKDLTSKMLLGIVLGLSMNIKHNAILIFATLGIYDLIRTKRLKDTIKNLFLPYSIGVFIFLIFYLVIPYLTDPELVSTAISVGGTFLRPGFNMLGIMLILFFQTPYILGLGFLSSIDNNVRRNRYSGLFLTWIISNLFFYILIIGRGDAAKYTMNIMLPVAVLVGLYLSKIRVTKKEVLYGIVLATLFFTITYLLNLQKIKMVPRISDYYLHELSTLNFNFLFSYTGPSGPTFGVSMLSIIIMLITSSILLLFYLIIRSRHTKKVILITFIAVTLSYNTYLISEYFFSVNSPDISEVQHTMVKYFHNNLDYPLFSNEEGIMFTLNNQYEAAKLIDNKTVGLPDKELDEDIKEQLKILKEKDRGSLLILNWPPIPVESPIWNFTKYCDLKKTFTSNGYEGGYAYTCSYKDIIQ